MVKIDQKPETPLSPIQFFVSRRRAEFAISELASHLEARPYPLPQGLYPPWYVKVAHRGYLRKSGEVF